MGHKPLNTKRRMSHVVLAQTLKLILDGPVTPHEIAEHTGLYIVTAQEWMRGLRKEGVVHISGWVPDALGRDVTPVYSVGKGRDKPRRRLSTAQRSADYRARLRQRKQDQMLALAL